MFEAGDLVKCIDDRGWSDLITKGSTYKIKRSFKNYGEPFVLLESGDNEKSIDSRLHSKRFELIKKESGTMFKVGDKVWSVDNGWGEVIKIVGGDYPIRVRYKHNSVTYTAEGKRYYIDKSRSLFFEEIPIPETALSKPKWRAIRGECYNYVCGEGIVIEATELDCHVDNRRFEAGNYFRTVSEAKESKFYKVFHD